MEVFICTAVQIILWLFVQVHCRAAFTLSSRLPLFVYTLQPTVLYLAGAHAMYTVEDEAETNTNSLNFFSIIQRSIEFSISIAQG